MNATERVTVVIPSAAVSDAKGVIRRLDPQGDGAFTSPLSPTGVLPVTHLWTSWQCTPAEAAFLLNPPAGLVSRVAWQAFDARSKTPEQVIADLGLMPVSTVID